MPISPDFCPGTVYTSVAGTHLPICTRRQQKAAASVAISVSYPQSVSSVVSSENAEQPVIGNKNLAGVVSHSGGVQPDMALPLTQP